MATKRKGKRWTQKKHWFSSSEAARYLGVSVDTIRQLDEGGQLRASRTDGGHRRFSRDTLARYLSRKRGDRRSRLAQPAKHPPRPVSRPEPVQEPLRDEPEDFDPGDQDVERASVSPTPAPAPPLDPLERVASRMAEWLEREEAGRQLRRLATLKQYGLSQVPYGTPDTWHARVALALERVVTLNTFPNWIDDSQAHAIVRGKVEEVLQPYREEVARKKADEARREEDARDERRVQQLIEFGKRHASSEIPLAWHWGDRDHAARDVERMLKDSVEADWSEQDVKDAVDDELDEWEDDDLENDEEDES